MKHDTTSRQQQGFIKLMRSPFTIELLRDLLAFGLLALIAFRARWRSGFSADGLEIGEALIGDHKNCGMTRREYRTRLARLLKWGLITARPTPKGTIAKLASNAVFDINPSPNEWLTSAANAKNRPSKRPTVSPLKNHAERPTERPTGGQQAANRRPLTNKERRKERKNDELITLDNSTLTSRSNAHGQSSSSNLVSDLKEAEKYPDWPQFAAYCKSKGGSPTLKGFNTWLKSQSSRNGSKTSKPIPIAKRNKIINELNCKKQRIYSTFPDGKFADWAKHDLAVIDGQLQKL